MAATMERGFTERMSDTGVLTLTLTNAGRYNPLTRELLDDLRERLAEAADDDAVRVVVIAAEGKAFSAGHDLAEVRSGTTEAEHQSLFDACGDLMLQINRMPQPVIAQVQGIATGAGCQLVAACDLAVASDDARLATSGINLGLFCGTPSVAVSRAIAPKHAMEMLLTGEFIDAATAARIGLINRAVPADELEGEVDRLAETIAAKAPTARRLGKQLFYRQLGMSLPDAYADASRTMARNMMAEDAQAGIDAFLNRKRR
ncbi:enoyl-CoA hydratase [Arhodomonas aquaeolei]|uniref:enoyl-CoA hydratase n=2 Tax=Ectothiorhodospiraceae TaxID=72276 RepID=UPI000378A9BD|nr:enoyl-CoA hydratase [Arhodomonas aquaeolei]MCS4504534.1 enoyl-CoA hydratase [Arhodomonas aquaeolei]